MKKVLLFLFLLFGSFALFAQEPEVPTGVSDLLSNLGNYLGSLAGLAGVVIFITAILNTVFNLTKKWIKLLIALVVSIAVAVLTNLLNFGLFAESAWLETLLYGVGLGVVAGGIFDIPTIKILVNLILSLLLKFKKPE
jgi:xanthine/uracil permease